MCKRVSQLLEIVIFACIGLSSACATMEVWPGVEVLVRERADELVGKRIGILTNPTGVDRNLISTIDLVRNLPGVNVVRLFAPEHGLRGGYFAGIHVDETRDPVSGLPIVSLYGKTRRATPEMLQGLDVILYDIQDVGHRSYTFVSSLTYLMEECEKAGVAVWVLDRPDPMGGNIVDGPMIEKEYLSFIGVHTVPQVYGMTPGEWARMIQAERTPKIKLRVIPMKGWKRGMTYGDLGWPWVPPSQHIPHWETSYFYGMTGTIGELSAFNVGVGTPTPFELLGAPWLNGVSVANDMNALRLPGVLFRPVTFTPKYAAYKGEACSGIQIHLTDPQSVNPAQIGLALMAVLLRNIPRQFIFPRPKPPGSPPSMFLKALGDRRVAESLAKGKDPRLHEARINEDLKIFLERRSRYLIYD